MWRITNFRRLASVNVNIIYCGVWDHRPKFELVQSQILDEFGADKVNVSGKAHMNHSGIFNVLVNDQLVHEKLAGDGHVDNDAKLNRIFQAIDDAL